MMNVEELEKARWYLLMRNSSERYIEELRDIAGQMYGANLVKTLQAIIEEEDLHRRQYEKAYNEVAAAIEKVKTDTYRQLLSCHYLKGLTLKATAEEMIYCHDYIRRIKAKALEAFEKV